MTILFFTFASLAIIHFVYEGIIAPSIRLELRYEAFKMRDKLRKLKIEHGDQVSDEIFQILQRSLNNEIALLHRANISNFYYASKELGNSKKAQEEIERIERLVSECPIEEVQEIRNSGVTNIAAAFVVNAGGWLIYIIPIALIVKSYNSIILLAKRLMGLSESDIDRMFPPTPTTGFYRA